MKAGARARRAASAGERRYLGRARRQQWALLMLLQPRPPRRYHHQSLTAHTTPAQDQTKQHKFTTPQDTSKTRPPLQFALEYTTRLFYLGVGLYLGVLTGVATALIHWPADAINGELHLLLSVGGCTATCSSYIKLQPHAQRPPTPAPPPRTPAGIFRGLFAAYQASCSYLAEGERLTAARRGGGVPLSHPAKGNGGPQKKFA